MLARQVGVIHEEDGFFQSFRRRFGVAFSASFWFPKKIDKRDIRDKPDMGQQGAYGVRGVHALAIHAF